VPFSYVQYPGNGSTVTFTVPFPYLLRAHVKLYYGLSLQSGGYTQLLADGVNYTWTSATQVQLSAAPVVGQTLSIRRETPTTSRLVDWNDGSALTADALDTADLQNFYAIQEHKDYIEVLGINPNTNVADGSITANKLSSDAVTTIKIQDGAVTSNKIQDGAVTSGKIQDGAIVNADVNASAGIAASKLAFTQSGTGAVARTVESKLRDVANVRDFGIGSGTTDDTTKIQTLLNEISAGNGGEIVFDSDNNYLVSSTIYIPSNLVIRFTGLGFITLTQSTVPGGVFIVSGTESVPAENVVIYNPRVDAANFGYPAVGGENGIGGTNCKNIQIYGGTIKNCRRGSYSPAGAGGKGVQFEDGVENILVDGTTILNCTVAVEVGGVADVVSPVQFRRYRNVQYRSLRVFNCDRVVSVIHGNTPADTTPDTGLVQISDILAYNCGRESVVGTEKTFGAIVLDRASNVSIANFFLGNSSTYGDLGAVIRQPRGTNCTFDVTFIGNADALVLYEVGSTGFGAGDTCEGNTYRVSHKGTTGWAIAGDSGQAGAIFKNTYDMRLSTVNTGLINPSVAFDTHYCRFANQSRDAFVEGQADKIVAVSNVFQSETFRTAGTVSISAGASDKISTNSNGRPFVRHAANDNVAVLQSDATSGFTNNIAALLFAGYSPNNATARFLFMADTVTTRAEIRSNGGIANFQANDVNLSDINTKKDISPAASTWDCIKGWEIVNYHYKDQPEDADLNLGVIAQQVVESCPEVVTVFQEAKEATEDAPAQEERLGVKEQQMYWMAIKALQEALVRIEILEANFAANG